MTDGGSAAPTRQQLEAQVKQAERRLWRPIVFVALAVLLTFWPSTHVAFGRQGTIWKCQSTAFDNYENPEGVDFLGYDATGGTIHAAELQDLPDSTVAGAIDSCHALGRSGMGSALTALVFGALYWARRYWVLSRKRKALDAYDGEHKAAGVAAPVD